MPDAPKLAAGEFEVLIQELKLRHVRAALCGRNYDPKTIKAYKSCLLAFVRFFAPRHPRELTEEDIRAYLLHVIQEQQLYLIVNEGLFTFTLPRGRKIATQY